MIAPAGPNRTRLNAVAAVLLVLAFLIVARTLYLQLGGPTRWSHKAHQQQTANLAEPPKRGRLLDRRGRVLVDHAPRFLLTWQPREPASALPETLERMLEPSRRKLLQNGLAAPVENAALPGLSELVSRTPGLTLQQISTRAYPHGALACHAVGYIRETVISRLPACPSGRSPTGAS